MNRYAFLAAPSAVADAPKAAAVEGASVFAAFFAPFSALVSAAFDGARS
ncbi:hypothetical protein [Streptomyces sp. NPDC090036]